MNRNPNIDLLRGIAIFAVLLLSGFLITSIALRRYTTLERIDVWHFYRMRAARILPPLLLALLVIVLLALAGLDIFRNTGGGHDLPDSYLAIAVFSVLTFF